eukprot:CAMPEP_0184329632 /NCGR_PEP_ID=MMETSP1049-20130417/144254_1 /TAXON_ID=77928 /ORGANISM="Proteomonas sulcata, Strain CCMP704" /LENGTH=348 /DNA_ID=CAMNT_0026652015 /DNA_START=1414 /DNA_END=2460 /DNA_ORIENTATION=-
MAELMGVSCEELMSRLCNHEVRLGDLVTEIDLVAMSMESSMCLLSGKYSTQYRVMTKKPLSRNGQILKEGILLKIEQRVELDCGTGKSATFVTPVDAEEYDRVKALNPDLCRSLQRMIGDDRSGSELLAQHAQDTRVSLRKMKKTDVGRLKLNALAASIRRQITPSLDFVHRQTLALQTLHDSQQEFESSSVMPNKTSSEVVRSPQEGEGTLEDRGSSSVSYPDCSVDHSTISPDVDSVTSPYEDILSISSEVGTPIDDLLCLHSTEDSPETPQLEGFGFSVEVFPFHDQVTTGSLSSVDGVERPDTSLLDVEVDDKIRLDGSTSTSRSDWCPYTDSDNDCRLNLEND